MKGSEAMNRLRKLAIATLGVMTLAGAGACTGDDVEAPEPGQPTGGPGAVETTTEVPEDAQTVEVEPASPVEITSDASTEQPTLEPDEVTEEAPEGGAVARVGNRQEPISTIACTEIDGVWAMSGGEEDTTKVAVRTMLGDDMTVDSASVIFTDGIVAQMQPGDGEASITREGDSFVVTGTAQRLNLHNPDEEPIQVPFVIQAACDS